ncbi:hypothetical protein Pan216_38090 [Planctomycetes bacterium Pan216]|uniref:Uncharacterized protein n=1 Tax=Kolteria novifilia TaxID=2527975 RepID=A0A518B7I0_9BACT|nr:hypothetical protein Pan216_38090 [Planctomycetes bacterium Pan216]
MSLQGREWESDWSEFVNRVSRDFGDGLSGSEVSRIYGNSEVEWTGKVTDTELDNEYNPSIQMEMPSTAVELADGRQITVDFLNLCVEEEDVESWRSVEPGNVIKFKTTLPEGNGPFPGLRWAELDSKRGYIEILTSRSELVEIIDQASR